MKRTGIKLLKATGIIFGSLAAFFLFLAWAILLPQTGWRGIAGMVALIFLITSVLVVKAKKRKAQEQPPVPVATIVRDDIEVPDERPRERERELE